MFVFAFAKACWVAWVCFFLMTNSSRAFRSVASALSSLSLALLSSLLALCPTASEMSGSHVADASGHMSVLRREDQLCALRRICVLLHYSASSRKTDMLARSSDIVMPADLSYGVRQAKKVALSPCHTSWRVVFLPTPICKSCNNARERSAQLPIWKYSWWVCSIRILLSWPSRFVFSAPTFYAKAEPYVSCCVRISSP